MSVHDDNDIPEPFSVDIFCEHFRFSPPPAVQVCQHLLRWSIYIFIPFLVCLTLASGAVSIIVNPIEVPLDTSHPVNITAVVFFGIVIPGVLLIAWYRSIPWWFLNGTERGWKTLQLIAEANGHRFPGDFWHPFIHDGFVLQTDTFDDEWIINSETDIDGFIGSDINISFKYVRIVMKSPVDQFNFYLDSAYWRLEEYGLRFYGERMNIFVPYLAIQTVKKGAIWCNIVLKFDTSLTEPWTEILLSIGHFPTKRGDRMLRDALFQKIFAAKAVDLIEQLTEEK
jgi:hypothetical protein